MANMRNPFSPERKQSWTPYVVMLLVYIIYSLYTSQVYNAYMCINGLVEYKFMDVFYCYSIIFTKDSLLYFNVSAVIDIFLYKFWYHIIAILLLLYIRISMHTNGYKGIEGGSSNIATEEQKESYRDPTGIPIAKDLYVPVQDHPYQIPQTFGRKKEVVQLAPFNLNQLIIGSPGCGKTLRVLSAQLLQGKLLGNYVVTDPKGELFTNTAKFFEEQGYDITVLNLFDPTFSNGYNPFAYAKTENDILNLADMFMKASAGDGQKTDFWTGSALQMLSAVLLYIHNTADERKDFRRVLELISSISYSDQKISPSCEYSQCMIKYCQERVRNKQDSDAVTVYWKAIQGMPEQTLGGVVATVNERLRLWMAQSINNLTREDEMHFEDFANPNKHKIIYIIVPASDRTYAGVVTMFYTQLFKELETMAIKAKGRLPIRCNCIMDEFASMNPIKDFDAILSVVRGFNIRIAIVVQSIQQIEKEYEKALDTIISCSGIITYLGTQNDSKTTKWFVENLGTTTIKKEGRSTNFGNTGGGSDSESAEKRNLFDANELSRYCYGLTIFGNVDWRAKKYGGRCINVVNTLLLCDYKYDIFNHKNFKLLGSPFSKEAMARQYDMEAFYKKHGKKDVRTNIGFDKDVSSNIIQTESISNEFSEQGAYEELTQNELAARFQAALNSGGEIVPSETVDNGFIEINDALIEAEKIAKENDKFIREQIEAENLKNNVEENTEAIGDNIEDLITKSDKSRYFIEKEREEKEKKEKQDAQEEHIRQKSQIEANLDAQGEIDFGILKREQHEEDIEEYRAVFDEAFSKSNTSQNNEVDDDYIRILRGELR